MVSYTLEIGDTVPENFWDQESPTELFEGNNQSLSQGSTDKVGVGPQEVCM